MPERHSEHVNRQPVVEVRNLVVDRGSTRAVDDVSFSVPTGTVMGLLGPSGCGKSSLMRAVVGVQIVAGGSVTVLGQPAGSAPLRDRIGYVTQAPSVYDDLTVSENLTFFGRVLGVGPDEVDRCIEAVDLTRHRDKVVNNLSGGERSRASLAVALLGEPELLVLDEPTVGLDPVLREDLWQTFRELAERGVTLLVSSHVMDEAARCDDLLLMRDGHLLATLTPAELRERTGEEDMERAFLRLIDRKEVLV